MAIQYTMTGNGHTLLVDAWGFDESLAEVQAYGLAIIQACLGHGYTHVLCNELALEYRLGTLDIYRAAEFVSTRATRVVKVAIVYNPQFVADARFWEDVAINRGLTVRFFKEIDDARAWLYDASGDQGER